MTEKNNAYSNDTGVWPGSEDGVVNIHYHPQAAKIFSPTFPVEITLYRGPLWDCMGRFDKRLTEVDKRLVQKAGQVSCSG